MLVNATQRTFTIRERRSKGACTQERVLGARGLIGICLERGGSARVGRSKLSKHDSTGRDEEN